VQQRIPALPDDIELKDVIHAFPRVPLCHEINWASASLRRRLCQTLLALPISTRKAGTYILIPIRAEDIVHRKPHQNG
jgi:hypothetical protein